MLFLLCGGRTRCSSTDEMFGMFIFIFLELTFLLFCTPVSFFFLWLNHTIYNNQQHTVHLVLVCFLQLYKYLSNICNSFKRDWDNAVIYFFSISNVTLTMLDNAVTYFFSISIVTLTMLPYVWKAFFRKSSVMLHPDTKMVLPCRGLSARPSRFSVRPLSSRSRADTKLSYKFCISTHGKRETKISLHAHEKYLIIVPTINSISLINPLLSIFNL